MDRVNDLNVYTFVMEQPDAFHWVGHLQERPDVKVEIESVHLKDALISLYDELVKVSIQEQIEKPKTNGSH